MKLTPEQEAHRREGVARAHARHREATQPAQRWCTKCKQYKPVGMFYQQKTYTNEGVEVLRPMSWCRRCVRRSQNRKRRLQRSSLT